MNFLLLIGKFNEIIKRLVVQKRPAKYSVGIGHILHLFLYFGIISNKVYTSRYSRYMVLFYAKMKIKIRQAENNRLSSTEANITAS